MAPAKTLHASANGVAFQQAVERVELRQIRRLQRPPLVRLHEAPEPLAQMPCLIGDLIELAGQRQASHAAKNVSRHQPRLAEPIQQALAVVDPIDWPVERSGDRVEEIEAGRVADKKRG